MKLFPDSVFRKNGEWKKLVVGFWTMCLGGAVSFAGDHSFKNEISMYMSLFGWFVAFAGFVFLMSSTRCPNCKSNLVWLAASKRNIEKRWGKGLMQLSECPECKSAVHEHNNGLHEDT